MIAWAITHGIWPVGEIDHRDGVRDNNKLTNLHDVPLAHNRQNLHGPTSKNRHSGVLGAHKNDNVYRSKPWRVKIVVNGKPKHIGYYATTQGAHEAYVAAKHIYHEGNTL